MKLPFLIFSGALGLVGGVILWLRNNSRKGSQAMAATRTSRAADIARALPGMLVEVKGTIRCETPVQSEFTNAPAVYFRSEIDRQVRYEETNSDGKTERKTRRENAHRQVRHVPFRVEDESGSVLVRMEGADVDAVKVYEANQPPDTVEQIANILTGGHTQFDYREYVLAPDTPVYVLGTVQADRSIGPPPENARPDAKVFIVSYKSEEEQAKSAKWSQLAMLVAALAVFGLALWLFKLGLG